MVDFITVLVLAHPDDFAAHAFRKPRLRGVTVCQDQQTVIAILMGILDGLLETCAATADGQLGFIMKSMAEAHGDRSEPISFRNIWLRKM